MIKFFDKNVRSTLLQPFAIEEEKLKELATEISDSLIAESVTPDKLSCAGSKPMRRLSKTCR